MAKASWSPLEELSEAKASLIRSHVLIELANDSVKINTAYRDWIFPESGRRRLSQSLLRFIEGGRT